MTELRHKEPPAIAGGTDFITDVIIARGLSARERETSRPLAMIVAVIVSLLLFSPISSSAIEKANKRKERPVKRQLTRTELKEAEARLAEMGYATGRVDGVIDDVTRSGLIVFQKWEGRKVTGRLSREDFDAIMSAEAPQVRDSGYKHIEVDLDRQVLLLTDEEGTIIKILPVSTGSNKRYKEKRVSGLAYTPRGRFRITGKIAGWRKSDLGLLYYPSYFSGGLAIHGNPSVPETPQSHGCIRIPMSAAEEMFKALPVGTIVLIYDTQSFVSAKEWAAADKREQEAQIR